MIRTIDIPQEDWFDEYDTFFDAIKRGDIDAVTAMLDAGASTEIPRDGRTPLMIAIHGHHIDIVRLLLERHAEVNNSFFDPPPIFHAVMTGEHAPEIIQLLIDHGANLEATTKDTRLGLLHWAAGHGMLHATEFLISKGLDIERTGGTEKTPLIIAAEKGQTEIVKLLHAKGADLNARSNNGGTPLIWASNGGHAETVRFLLENGARTEDCDKSGMTALSIASLEGFIEIVRMLLEKGANVNATSEKPLDATPALYAATEGHAQVLQELIRHGADLSIVFEEETTILEAAMQNRRYNTTKVLLEAIGGPDYPKDSVALQIAMTTRIVDGLPLIKSIPIMFQHIRSASAPVREFDWIEWVLDQGGDLVRPRAMRSLMHHALQTEGGDMVAELLRLGVDPNITVFGKGTPLHVAVRYRDEDTIKVLLDAGADPSRLGTSTELPMITPLHLALEQWNDDEQKDTSIIDILLATGRCKLMVGDDPKSTAFAYVLRQFGRWEDRAAEKLAIRMLESIPDVNNDRCGTGYTLMHVAVRFGETELVDFLKHKGADMNPKDECGNTPFLMACHGDPDILDFLILWGADVHAVDDHGRCALHIAAANEQVQILQLLLDLTGDNALKIDATDNLGHSPLMTAMAAGCEEAALYLLSRGASPRHRMNKGRTVFRYAAMASMHRVADKILTEPDSKDLVNEQTEDGWTPLAAACTSPSPTIISKLLSHGANINTANPFSGMTPLHLALERPLKMAVRDARNKENPAVTLLQDPNIDATARDANLRTALHFAAAFKNLAATRDLLAQSEVAALVNEADAKGMTALCLCPDPGIAQLLIDYGADVNYADPNGWTPLHFAVDMRAVKTYEVLMDNGADENVRTKDDGLTVRERIRSLGGKKVWERSGYNLIMEDKMMRMRDDDMYREREDGMNRERGGCERNGINKERMR